MKSLKNYMSVIALSLTAIGCTTDLDHTTYNPANATAAVLEPLATEYILTADNQDLTAIDFKWAEANFGFNAAATNNLEFDVAGKEFAGATTLTSMGNGGAFSVTNGELNSAIMKLLDSYTLPLTATELEFRVVSSFSDGVTPLYSNIETATITPYEGTKQYPLIAVIGDYSGWNFENSQKLFSADESTLYTAMIAFNGKSTNGWKISELTGWKGGNWGAAKDAAFEAEQSPITLWNDGGSGNLSCYAKNFYKLSFDTKSCELSVVASYDTWGVVGDHNNWGNENDDKTITPDSPMTYSSELDKSGALVHFLTATVDLKAGQGWKLRADNAWGANRGPGSFSGGEPAAGGDNFAVEADGKYAVRWYFNSVDEKLMLIPLASSTPAEINTLEATYTLEQEKEADTALTLTWAAANLSTNEPISNAIEMDLVGKEFANKVALGTVTDGTEFTITHLDLNKAITNLLKAYNMEIAAADIEFRVYSTSTDASTSPAYSNVVTTAITPYIEKLAGDDAAVDQGYTGPDNSAYAAIALRGDYNSWGFDAAEHLYSANNDDIYEAMIYLDGKGGNGWKLCADADWTLSWGLASENEEAEASPLVLAEKSNININNYTKNSYKATFNKATAEFSISNPHTSWGVVGAFNGWGSSDDIQMALACRDNVYYLHATLKLEADSEWKIRPDSDWGEDFGFKAVTVGDEFKTAEDNGNFKVPEAGVYTIRWYFNSVNQEVRVIKHAE